MNFIRAGFRSIRENPALAWAEIAWRWSFGFAAWVLTLLTVRAIFSTIEVSQAEIELAHKWGDPYVVADVAARFIVQALPKIITASVILVPAVTVLWIAAATIGRAITLRNLCPAAAGVTHAANARRLLLLNLVRALFTLATAAAFFGTILLVSASHPEPQNAPFLLLVWIMLAMMVGFFWGVVNWFLALAAIPIVRDGRGVFTAIGDSLGLYRERPKDYSAITVWFSFFRGAALVVALVGAAVATVGGSAIAVLAASIVVGLLYFAIADYLYIARLAAFVALAEPGPVADVAPALAPAPQAEPPALAPVSESETETRN